MALWRKASRSALLISSATLSSPQLSGSKWNFRHSPHSAFSACCGTHYAAAHGFDQRRMRAAYSLAWISETVDSVRVALSLDCAGTITRCPAFRAHAGYSRGHRAHPDHAIRKACLPFRTPAVPQRAVLPAPCAHVQKVALRSNPSVCESPCSLPAYLGPYGENTAGLA